MLNLRTEKLNTVLNQVAANVANLVGREIRRSNRNGMILAVDVVNFREHVTNLWFANATTPVELRATDECVWDTFVSILTKKESLSVTCIETSQSNYVQLTTLEELPSVSFEFNSESLNFTASGLTPRAFISELRYFVNTMSRRPFSEQAWFEKNYPSASNFGEAFLMLLANHSIGAREFFADNEDEVVELQKLLTSKLVQHGVYKEDLIQGNVTTSEKVCTTQDAPAQTPKPQVAPTTHFGEQLSAAIAEVKEVETVEVTNSEIEAELDASTQDTETAERALREVYEDLSGCHASAGRGKQRKQVVRALSKATSLADNSDSLLTLLDLVEIDENDRDALRSKIHAAVSTAAAVETSTEDLDSLDSLSEEFESDDFEANLEEPETSVDEVEEDEDDSFEFETEDEVEEEVEEDEVEEDEVEEDEVDEIEQAMREKIEQLSTQPKGKLRQQARKLGMPLSKSCSSDVPTLATFIANNL